MPAPAFLRSIPYELEQSARLDGAGTWTVFWKLQVEPEMDY